MKHLFYSCIFSVICLSQVVAQPDSTAEMLDHFVPLELTDFKQLCVELCDPLSISELNESVYDDLIVSEKKYERFEAYNKINYRLINQYLTKHLTKADSSIAFVYYRDILEKTDKHRFIILNDIDADAVVKQDGIHFYIFDTEKNQSYYRFSSVAALVKALEIAKKSIEDGDRFSQQELDEKIAGKIFKSNQRAPLGLRIALGVIAYGTFQALIIIIPNLEP